MRKSEVGGGKCWTHLRCRLWLCSRLLAAIGNVLTLYAIMTYIRGSWRVVRIGFIIVFAHIVQAREVGTSGEVMGRTKVTLSIKLNWAMRRDKWEIFWNRTLI